MIRTGLRPELSVRKMKVFHKHRIMISFPGVCTAWTLISLFLTGAAYALNIFAHIEPTYYAIFDILGEDKFTVAVTVLYVIVLMMVATSDTLALVYACRYKSKRINSSPSATSSSSSKRFNRRLDLHDNGKDPVNGQDTRLISTKTFICKGV